MHDSNELSKGLKQTFRKPFTLPLSFPQRIAKAKVNLQIGKFLEFLKKLYISILFIDALSQMPCYAKFLMEILTNTRKVKKHEIVALTKKHSFTI